MNTVINQSLLAVAAIFQIMPTLAELRHGEDRFRMHERCWVDIFPSLPDPVGACTTVLGLMFTYHTPRGVDKQIHLTVDHNGRTDLLFYTPNSHSRDLVLSAEGFFAWLPGTPPTQLLAAFCNGLLDFLIEGKLPNSGNKLERMVAKGFIYANFTTPEEMRA